MMLCIDVGNSHIYGGVFDGEDINVRFRYTSKAATSDEIGLFLKAVLRENGCDPTLISSIAICSVVPQVDYSLRAACHKYFDKEPFFLQAGVKTGLHIKYSNPLEVGADRIANAIAAVNRFAQTNLIIIDFGTGTTFCAINAQKSYLGGAILPGMRLSVESLAQNTARLPRVEIVRPETTLGRSTIDGIQSGVFWGTVGACKQIIANLKAECFANQDVLVIATGGFASMFEKSGVYDVLIPDLVLQGVRIAALLNTN